MTAYGRVSGSIHRQELSLPFYEEVLEFLSQGPSAQEIITFRPGPKAQERFDHLLDINRERPLTVEEEEELDHYIRIEQMMSLLKAKAYSGTSGGVY